MMTTLEQRIASDGGAASVLADADNLARSGNEQGLDHLHGQLIEVLAGSNGSTSVSLVDLCEYVGFLADAVHHAAGPFDVTQDKFLANYRKNVN